MKNIDKLLTRLEERSPFEKFHEYTKNEKLANISQSNYPKSWIKIHFKTYPRLNKIKLGTKDFNRKNSVSNLIKARRSNRNFTGKEINLEDLSYLLSNSAGINLIENSNFDTSKRGYPSAGARYSLEIYPLILNCRGLKKGLYHYNVKENLLELLLEKDLRKWLQDALGGEKWPIKASVIFIITSVLRRTTIKYGDRGYRYSLIEAGHLAQNLHLLAMELEFGSCAIGGYLDSKFDELLDISLQKEFTLYLVAIGKV